MSYQFFEDLIVWKRGNPLAVLVYRSRRTIQDDGLRDQMQRAAVSIRSNIVEGYERSPKELMRLLRIAMGPRSELRTQALVASEIG